MDLVIKYRLPTKAEFMQELENTFAQKPTKAMLGFGLIGSFFLQIFGFDLSNFVSSIPALVGAIAPIFISAFFTVRKKIVENRHEKKMHKVALDRAKVEAALAKEREREVMRLAMMDSLILKGIIIPGTMKAEEIFAILKNYEEEL